MEGSWIHSALVVMGLFEVNYMHDPLFKKKKKTQRTKSAYEMKEVGSCSPNSEALEDCALLIDVGFIGQKLTCYKPTTVGLKQLLTYGSDFFFFFNKHGDLIEYAGTTIICNYDFYGCILVW